MTFRNFTEETQLIIKGMKELLYAHIILYNFQKILVCDLISVFLTPSS